MTKYGAYDSSKIYYPKDIKKLVLYGKARGVKIIPELDAPAHAGAGSVYQLKKSYFLPET
jgi:N-acetyl-beta-hexosaminidase